MHKLRLLRTILTMIQSFAWLTIWFESSFLFHLKRRTNKVMSLMEKELCNNWNRKSKVWQAFALIASTWIYFWQKNIITSNHHNSSRKTLKVYHGVHNWLIKFETFFNSLIFYVRMQWLRYAVIFFQRIILFLSYFLNWLCFLLNPKLGGIFRGFNVVKIEGGGRGGAIKLRPHPSLSKTC